MKFAKFSIAWKRGFTRVWIVGAGAWLVFVAVERNAVHTAVYTWNYWTDRPSLETPEIAKQVCQFDRAVVDFLLEDKEPVVHPPRPSLAFEGANPDTGRMFRQIADAQRQQEAEERVAHNRWQTKGDAVRASCVTNFRARRPDWTWLSLALLPPTLGVAVLVLVLLLTRFVLRWVIQGFKKGIALFCLRKARFVRAFSCTFKNMLLAGLTQVS